MDILSAVVTLFLIMDPLGNIPLFIAVLREVPPERRRPILLREIGFAYIVLLAFLFAGRYVMQLLQLDEQALSVAGGIVLFLIAIRMVFPGDKTLADTPEGEPFIVPLTIPLFAGPSALATLLLLEQTSPIGRYELLLAVTIAWAISGVILLSSTFFYRILREKGLMAMERLMGMVLVMLAVQMTMDGIKGFMANG